MTRGTCDSACSACFQERGACGLFRDQRELSLRRRCSMLTAKTSCKPLRGPARAEADQQCYLGPIRTAVETCRLASTEIEPLAHHDHRTSKIRSRHSNGHTFHAYFILMCSLIKGVSVIVGCQMTKLEHFLEARLDRVQPEALMRAGMSPAAKVLDLKGRLRCRGCGRKGRAVVSVKWRGQGA